MTPRDISSLDLNLLLALHVLLEELNVTRAARRFGRTQSAMSRSLARLREALGDPLLVRTRHGMRPTARARAIQEPVRRLVADAAAIISGDVSFDPSSARRTFTVMIGDSVEAALMPRLLAALDAKAPGISVVTQRESPRSADRLEDGQVDLVISPRLAIDEPHLRTQWLLDDGFACIVRAAHPLRQGQLDLDRYCDLRHALSAPLGTPGSIVDDGLTQLGRQRQVVFTAPSFLAVAHAVAQSELIATLPRSAARYFKSLFGLKVLRPPLDLPEFSVHQFWHERRHHDPGHAWLRGLVKAELASSRRYSARGGRSR